MKLRKVIVPIAGLGKRMHPATKAIPKEMLPINGKPAIQHVCEEIIDAGFEEIILITNPNKLSVRKYLKSIFSANERNKSTPNLSFINIEQDKPKGLGHAILIAEKVIKKESFAVVLPDMLLKNSNSNNNLALMRKNFDRDHLSSALFGIAKKNEISNYGIAKIKKIKNSNVLGLLESIIEKPSIKKAPSNLFAIGRYIFTSEIMNELKKISPDKNNEIQLTDAIDFYIKNNGKVAAYKAEGKYYDCGNKLGYLIANIEYSKSDSEIGNSVKKYLKNA